MPRQSPGLHDPPLPNYPAIQLPSKTVKQIPREQLLRPNNGRQADLPLSRKLPLVQARNFTQEPERATLTEARQQWVKRAFLHAYEGYKKRECTPHYIVGL